jgi:hypothetical protein
MAPSARSSSSSSTGGGNQVQPEIKKISPHPPAQLKQYADLREKMDVTRKFPIRHRQKQISAISDSDLLGSVAADAGKFFVIIRWFNHFINKLHQQHRP